MIAHLILAINPFFSSFTQSDLFGKLIFLALFVLSVLSWSLLIHKIRLTRKLQKIGTSAQNAFRKQRLQPLNFSFSRGNPFSRLYQRLHEEAIELINKNQTQHSQGLLTPADIEYLTSSLDTALVSERQILQKNLYILPTVVSLAPFLGLLGTVWGILVALGELQTQLSAAGSPAVLGGIAMALATTVLGLVVAIPPLIGFNYLKSAMRSLSHQFDDFTHSTLAAVEMTYRRVET